MDRQKYKDDLSEIRDIMQKSTRFISLSGLSGILAGIYALGGAALAYFKIKTYNKIDPEGYAVAEIYTQEQNLTFDLFFIAAGVVILAFLSGLLLSVRKARRTGENLWNLSSKRVLFNFGIPLITGGIFCLVLLQYGYAALIAPTTLIFYGLSCLNASKYTLGDVRYLGLANILIGLVATQFVGYGLYFWALGFGVLHIFYGSLMHYKYDKNL